MLSCATGWACLSRSLLVPIAIAWATGTLDGSLCGVQIHGSFVIGFDMAAGRDQHQVEYKRSEFGQSSLS